MYKKAGAVTPAKEVAGSIPILLILWGFYRQISVQFPTKFGGHFYPVFSSLSFRNTFQSYSMLFDVISSNNYFLKEVRMSNCKGNIMKTKELVSPSAVICVPVKYPGCWYVLSPTRKETSSEACQARARFQQHRDASFHQVFFFCKARRQRKFTPFWQKHYLVSFLVGLRTYQHPCIFTKCL